MTQYQYLIRRNFQTYGADGLLDRLPGVRELHPNRVSEAIEQAVLDYSLKYPSQGLRRKIYTRIQLPLIAVSHHDQRKLLRSRDKRCSSFLRSGV